MWVVVGPIPEQYRSLPSWQIYDHVSVYFSTGTRVVYIRVDILTCFTYLGNVAKHYVGRFKRWFENHFAS